MGTRGLVGFRVDDVLKVAYNHSDSYPSHLGVNTLEWLRSADVDQVREDARALRVVEEGATPTAADIEALREFADLNVSSRRLDDWYVLLRKTQGRPGEMLRAGVIENGEQYGGIEWSYLIDLDANTFVVYEGEITGDPVDSWPLDALPTVSEFAEIDVDRN